MHYGAATRGRHISFEEGGVVSTGVNAGGSSFSAIFAATGSSLSSALRREDDTVSSGIGKSAVTCIAASGSISDSSEDGALARRTSDFGFVVSTD